MSAHIQQMSTSPRRQAKGLAYQQVLIGAEILRLTVEMDVDATKETAELAHAREDAARFGLSPDIVETAVADGIARAELRIEVFKKQAEQEEKEKS